jgi:hypothetical protein
MSNPPPTEGNHRSSWEYTTDADARSFAFAYHDQVIDLIGPVPPIDYSFYAIDTALYGRPYAD